MIYQIFTTLLSIKPARALLHTAKKIPLAQKMVPMLNE
jgi:hypothetical protein